MDTAGMQARAALPSVSNSARAPITTLLCVAAIVLSIVGWSSVGYDPFVVDGRALGREPWRLVVAHFLHADAFHLAGNLSWLWVFGRILEPRLGHVGLAAFALFVSVGGSLAEHAFDVGAIGLSGIVYGMWAFLVVIGWRFRELRALLGRGVHVLFVAWFALGFVFSAQGWMPISNVGHAAGALLGAVAAWSVGPDLRIVRARLAVPAGALLVLLAAATVARDRVNVNAYTDPDAWAGAAAYERGDWAAAEEHFSRAIASDSRDVRSWWYLASALAELNELHRSNEAGYYAYEAGIEDDEFLTWLVDSLLYEASEELQAGRTDTALEQARRALQIATARRLPEQSDALWSLACTHEHRGERREAADAGLRAFRFGKLDSESTEWLAGHLVRVTNDELEAGRKDSAFTYAQRAVEVAPESAMLWENVRTMAERTGRADWVERAGTELARLAAKPK